MPGSSINKKFSNLNYYAYIYFPLDNLLEYIKNTEKFVNDNISIIVNECEDKIKNSSSKEETDYLEDFYFEDIYKRQYLRETYSNSIFITLYSFLEQTLYKLCKISEVHYDIKLEDIKDRGVVQSIKYIRKLNIPIPKNHSKLSEYNCLRNILVHDPSQKITEKNKKKLNGIKYLKIENGTYPYNLKITNFQLLYDFHNYIKDFIEEIVTIKH